MLDEQFDKFFAAFPSSDAYRHWEKGRSFKIGERKAKVLFANILAEGKYTANDLIRALEMEIAMRKRRSIKENQFQYMKGVVNWLRDRVFEATLQLEQEATSSEDDVGYQKNIV